MKYCLGQLKHLDLGSIDDITKEYALETIDPRHVPTLPNSIDAVQPSIYSTFEEEKKKTVVVPKLKLMQASRQSDQTFSCIEDSLSERVKMPADKSTRKSSRRPVASTHQTSIDGDSITRKTQYTIDAKPMTSRAGIDPLNSKSVDRQFINTMHGTKFSQVGLRDVHVVVSSSNSLEKGNLASQGAPRAIYTKTLPDLNIMRSSLNSRT